MKINAANRLTLTRLIIIPFFLAGVVQVSFWPRLAALLLFIAASITDYYDGRIARSQGIITPLGTFLDPLADKLLICAAFIAFVQVDDFHVPAWMVVLIIGREFLITGLRTLAVYQGRILAAQPAGKFKTTSQLVAIISILIIMIVNSFLRDFVKPYDLTLLSQYSLWRFVIWIMTWGPLVLTFFTTVLTIVSGYIYLNQNKDLLNEKTLPNRQ